MKLNTEVNAPTTKAGDEVDLSARTGGDGLNPAYLTIAPGFYTAVVKEVTAEPFFAKWGSIANPDHPEGKWEYIKLIPKVILLNDNGTEISRQSFTVGVVKDGLPYRPDGRVDQLPIFGGESGAQFMLSALGMFQKLENGKFSLVLDTDILVDRVVRVRIATGGYIKGGASFSPADLTKVLAAVNGDNANFTYDEVPALLDIYNRENMYVNEDGEEVTEGVRLKTKNIIAGWFALSKEQAAKGNFYYDEATKQVFLTKATYNEFLQAQEMIDTADDQVEKW